MADLDFVDQHNMVACLERTDGNAGFHQIVDFLTTSSIHYALTVSPTIYGSYIEQFWATAKSKTVNNVKQIHATVDGKTLRVKVKDNPLNPNHHLQLLHPLLKLLLLHHNPKRLTHLGEPKEVGDEVVDKGEDDRVVRDATTCNTPTITTIQRNTTWGATS
ncbi:hypothetical protein Tco_0156657 [Tanacetum coccineum]